MGDVFHTGVGGLCARVRKINTEPERNKKRRNKKPTRRVGEERKKEKKEKRPRKR